MSVSVAIATMASTQAAIASAQAHQARITACNAMVPNYSAQTATVAEAKNYADCVYLLHPTPANAAEVWVIKAVIILALVGAVIGVFCWRENYDTAIDYLMRAIFGALSLPLLALIVVAALYGIRYLFVG